MSDPIVNVNVAEWVERARADPVAYQQRQTVEITLNAIARTAPLKVEMFLKGGILMGLAYDSPRQTTDIDLTTALAVEGGVGDEVRKLLDSEFPRAAAALGYADLILKTHSAKLLPKGKFPDAKYPALKLKIASAKRGTTQEKTLQEGKIPVAIDVDISFNEPLPQIQVLELTGGQELRAYGLVDLIAEKYRAMLQQVPAPPEAAAGCLRSRSADRSQRDRRRTPVADPRSPGCEMPSTPARADASIPRRS